MLYYTRQRPSFYIVITQLAARRDHLRHMGRETDLRLTLAIPQNIRRTKALTEIPSGLGETIIIGGLFTSQVPSSRGYLLTKGEVFPLAREAVGPIK